ncbi:hypothetical protein [Lewinella sp. 4G2]|uniref:hypothetical protein n=1 Tax=Lewinella sp. 4G2 TaxID=1803372 RepID=UPI0012FC1149|nr:hypothetical protein [Lewinella sp. 4G2]
MQKSRYQISHQIFKNCTLRKIVLLAILITSLLKCNGKGEKGESTNLVQIDDLQETKIETNPNRSIDSAGFGQQLNFIEANFPYSLADLNCSKSNSILIPDSVLLIVNESIAEYFESNESGRGQGEYLSTVLVRRNSIQFYQNIFEHWSGEINSNYFLLLNGEVVIPTTNLDIHALYNLVGNEIRISNLNRKFFSSFKEVNFDYLDLDGHFAATRLIHNGTYNALETHSFNINKIRDGLKVDTINMTTRKFEKSYSKSDEKCISKSYISLFMSNEINTLPSGDYDGDGISESLLVEMFLDAPKKDTTVIISRGVDYGVVA